MVSSQELVEALHDTYDAARWWRTVAKKWIASEGTASRGLRFYLGNLRTRVYTLGEDGHVYFRDENAGRGTTAPAWFFGPDGNQLERLLGCPRGPSWDLTAKDADKVSLVRFLLASMTEADIQELPLLDARFYQSTLWREALNNTANKEKTA